MNRLTNGLNEFFFPIQLRFEKCQTQYASCIKKTLPNLHNSDRDDGGIIYNSRVWMIVMNCQFCIHWCNEFIRNEIKWAVQYNARHLNPTKFNSNYKYTDLVFPLILTDFDRFTTVFSSVRTRTFSLFLFFTSQVQMKSSHKWNGKLINCRKKKLKNLAFIFLFDI